MLLDLPFFKALVRSTYLNPDSSGYEECYIFAATLLQSRPLLLTCHTESGAVFSRLPVSAFCAKPCQEEPLSVVEPYGCVSSQGSAIKHAYLKDYVMRDVRNKRTGSYLLTIDQEGGGWAEDPEQHKTFNLGFYDSGQLFALPNNFAQFLDNHFVSKDIISGDSVPNYARQTTYWRNND